MCKHGNTIVMPLKDTIDPGRKVRTVSIDRCIKDVMANLWTYGIQTLGCCCGHGERNPSIVINSAYSDKEIKYISDLIADVDDRLWDIYQWRIQLVWAGNRRNERYGGERREVLCK